MLAHLVCTALCALTLGAPAPADTTIILTGPSMVAFFSMSGAQLEAEPMVFTPKDYGVFLRAEVERWGNAVKAAGIHGD